MAAHRTGHGTFPVDLRAEKVVIDLPLKSDAGTIVYHFACRGGRDHYLDSLPDKWVGPLMCTLADGDRATEHSLLSEHDSAAWFSRGRFRGEEPIGECARYPEFGQHRSFRLRGFRLSLDAQDIRVDAGGSPASFVLAVAVVPDPTATTARAARPGYLDPRAPDASCRTPVRGQRPLMCRGVGGSWQVSK